MTSLPHLDTGRTGQALPLAFLFQRVPSTSLPYLQASGSPSLLLRWQELRLFSYQPAPSISLPCPCLGLDLRLRMFRSMWCLIHWVMGSSFPSCLPHSGVEHFELIVGRPTGGINHCSVSMIRQGQDLRSENVFSRMTPKEACEGL